MGKPITTIAICSSANFYRQAVDIEAQLDKMGYKVLLPKSAIQMKKSGNFDVSSRKTWYNNADDYHIKTDLIRSHFKEVDKADAILVLNYEKHGKANYIGGNVLMEMAIAFHKGTPIFVLNEIPEDSPFVEEIIGMGSQPLHGKLKDLRL